jgi:hypothetical protein
MIDLPINLMYLDSCVEIIRPIIYGEDCWYIESKEEQDNQIKETKKWIKDQKIPTYKLKEKFSDKNVFPIDMLIERAYEESELELEKLEEIHNDENYVI